MNSTLITMIVIAAGAIPLAAAAVVGAAYLMTHNKGILATIWAWAGVVLLYAAVNKVDQLSQRAAAERATFESLRAQQTQESPAEVKEWVKQDTFVAQLSHALNWRYVAQDEDGVWYAYYVKDIYGTSPMIGTYVYQSVVDHRDPGLNSSIPRVELDFGRCAVPVSGVLSTLISSVPQLEVNSGEWNEQYWIVQQKTNGNLVLNKVRVRNQG